MSPPKKPRRAILKQELVEMCGGDHIKALILERFLYKSRMAEEYADMQEQAGRRSNETDEASRGWITSSAAQLTKELMLGASQKTVRRRLSDLVSSGFLLECAPSTPWQGAMSYKVNTEYIQVQLFHLGYVLDGYGLPSPETLMNKQDLLPAEDPADAWDKVPSASANMVVQPELPGIKEMGPWIASQKLLKGAPHHIQIVSWLLWRHGGFTPHGTKKMWFSACSNLWEAAGGNEHVLDDAITTGQSAREKRGLTLSGPRSFMTFALDAKSRHTLQGRGVDASGEGKKDTEQGKLHGQNVSRDDKGKTVIEIGRKRG